jgi:hypothetical protein
MGQTAEYLETDFQRQSVDVKHGRHALFNYSEQIFVPEIDLSYTFISN